MPRLSGPQTSEGSARARSENSIPSTEKRPQYRSKRARWWYGALAVFLCAGMASVVTLHAPGRIVAGQPGPFPSLPLRSSYVTARGPIEAVENGYLPVASDESTSGGVGSSPSLSVRVIELFPDSIRLVASGNVLETAYLAQPVISLSALVQLANIPPWADCTAPDICTLKVPLIVESGATLNVTAPTRVVRLADAPGVLLGARGGVINLDGVTVESWSHDAPVLTGRWDVFRPFLLATVGGRLSATGSRFVGLGWDWNASYGVSWIHATGTATRSVFVHNFIGAYTAHSHDLVLRHNRFSWNELYGLDPHSYSSRLIVEDNRAEGNGSHGIIFSDHVTASHLEHNVVRKNGANGIMMDRSSSHNVIRTNDVESNAGDGIVLSDSDDDRIVNNTVRHNRVGIHGMGHHLREAVNGNVVEGNRLGSQGLTLADISGNLIHANGERTIRSWTFPIATWSLTALATLLFLISLPYRRRRRAVLAGSIQPLSHL